MTFRQSPSKDEIDLAENIDFEEISEHWNKYKLEDSTILSVKCVLTGVKKLARKSPDGGSIYVTMTNIVIRSKERSDVLEKAR